MNYAYPTHHIQLIIFDNSSLQESLRIFAQRQRLLTITTGISCVATLILYVTPMILLLVAVSHHSRDFIDGFTAYATVSCGLNSIVNIAIISNRQADISWAVKKILPFTNNAVSLSNASKSMRTTAVARRVDVVTPGARNGAIQYHPSFHRPKPRFKTGLPSADVEGSAGNEILRWNLSYPELNYQFTRHHHHHHHY